MSEKTTVTSPIDTSDSLDTYPTHYANKGKGGLHIVDTDQERNVISDDRQQLGMAVNVRQTSTSNPYGKISVLTSSNTWTDFPIRKLSVDMSGNLILPTNAKVFDMILTNDYLYICVQSYVDVDNLAVWKKLLLSNT